MGLLKSMAGMLALASAGLAGGIGGNGEFPTIPVNLLRKQARGSRGPARPVIPPKKTYGNRAAKAVAKRGYGHRRMPSRFDVRLMETMRKMQSQ